MLDRPSPNCDARTDGVPVDMLVLHYTGMESAEAALERLCDPAAEVSAHYLIDEDGTAYALVDEAQRAWHAGVASWRGETNINARSIGIELVNPGHEFGYRAFPYAQMTVLINLAQDILRRHPIPARNVVGHSDVAPTRKEDPGELFDWPRLSAAGIGVFPASPHPTDEPIDALLRVIGYDVTDAAAAIRAFQRRYRPNLINGTPDAETTGLARAVLDAAG